MVDISAKGEEFLSPTHPRFTMRLHRRQFVIGSAAFRPYSDWHCHQLNSSTWVSYCPELRASWTKSADGVPWVLLGLAVETLESRPEPPLQIAQTPSAGIPELYPSWAGRWVLIGGNGVHMDASGLLGCFYGTTPDGKIWVSSSPALLAMILSPDTDSRQLRYEQGFSWFTPPYSRFVGINRLLPSQVLELQDGSIRSRPLLPPINPALGYDETLDLLKQSLVTALKRLSQIESQLWLGLSAGVDSRLMLAIADYAKVDIMPFTRISARMSVGDRLLPPQLAGTLGYKHIFLRGKSQDKSERMGLVAEHTVGHVSEGDALPFLQSVRDSLEGISIGGWCFGVGKALGRKSLPDSIDDLTTCTQQIAQAYNEPLTSSAIAGIQEWLTWVQKTPQAHLDWRDRFYIEQRLAGWQSSKEQLYDLTKIARIPIINAARNYALMLGIAENRRHQAQYQIDLISRIAPQLSNYPYNPNDDYFGKLRAIAIKSSYYPTYVYRIIKKKLRF